MRDTTCIQLLASESLEIMWHTGRSKMEALCIAALQLVLFYWLGKRYYRATVLGSSHILKERKVWGIPSSFIRGFERRGKMYRVHQDETLNCSDTFRASDPKHHRAHHKLPKTVVPKRTTFDYIEISHHHLHSAESWGTCKVLQSPGYKAWLPWLYRFYGPLKL